MTGKCDQRESLRSARVLLCVALDTRVPATLPVPAVNPSLEESWGNPFRVAARLVLGVLICVCGFWVGCGWGGWRGEMKGRRESRRYISVSQI